MFDQPVTKESRIEVAEKSDQVLCMLHERITEFKDQIQEAKQERRRNTVRRRTKNLKKYLEVFDKYKQGFKDIDIHSLPVPTPIKKTVVSMQ